MNRRLVIVPVLVALLVAAALWFIRGLHDPQAEATHRVRKEPFSIWSPFEGTIQSLREQAIASDLSTRVSLTYLAPEGSSVTGGQVVARFDTGELDPRLTEAEKNLVLTASQLRSLEEAALPLELDELAAQRDETAQARAHEERMLAELVRLRERDLVSAQELAAQEGKTEAAQKAAARLEKKADLMTRVVHPTRVEAATAAFEAATAQVTQLREQVEHALVTADLAGQVVYLPLHLDGEFRTVREGDAVFRNQKFAIVADMSNLVVLCHVPESQVSLVGEGRRAMVTPVAFPNLRLEGRVEKVGQMALSQAGRPAWQRFFSVQIRLTDTHPEIRSGMSVYAQVLSYRREEGLAIPRAFVQWEGGQPYALVRRATGVERVALRIAAASDEAFEIAEGVQEGDVLVRRAGP